MKEATSLPQPTHKRWNWLEVLFRDEANLYALFWEVFEIVCVMRRMTYVFGMPHLKRIRTSAAAGGQRVEICASRMEAMGFKM